jgi:hypothetical protein
MSLSKLPMRLHGIVVFLVILSTLASMSLAHAQNLPNISMSTDKQSYKAGDKVTITGNTQRSDGGIPVTIIVRNPIGNVYEVGQVSLMNTAFVHDFVLSYDAQSGLYTVNIRQGNQTSQIQFQVITGQMQIIPVFDSEIRVTGENTTLIKYGNVEVSTADSSISIQVNTTKIQNGSIQEEYHIPKHVIDAAGGQLIVKEDGNSINCAQAEIDIERTLECPILSGTKEITIIGTTVIPEFTAAPYILVLSVITLVIFTRINLFKFR